MIVKFSQLQVESWIPLTDSLYMDIQHSQIAPPLKYVLCGEKWLRIITVKRILAGRSTMPS